MMMDFAAFKEAVIQNFMDYAPVSITNGELRVFQVGKDNGMKEALSVIVDSEVRDTWPMVYLDKMYENYQICGNLRGVMIAAGNFLEQGYQGMEQSYQMLDADNLRLNVEMEIVNTQLNEKLLKDAPHKEFQDLSVIYRWAVASDPVFTASSVVTDAILEKTGVTEEELYQCAVENTRRKNKAKVVSIEETMEGRHDMIDFGPGVTDKEAYLKKMIADAKANPQTTMWVLSNEQGQRGAVQMVYEENLRKIGEMMKTDLYIIPSSRHEVMVVSDGYMPLMQLEDMLMYGNQDMGDRADFLSNNIYHYDRARRKVQAVTDNPVLGRDMAPPVLEENRAGR